MSLELMRAKRQLTKATTWRVMNVIEEKTIGYHKWSDDISMSQFEKLSGLRDDKVYAALKELELLGLIVTERGKYGRIITIHPDFQSKARFSKSSPSAPKPSKKILSSTPNSGVDLPPNQGKSSPQSRGTTINTITNNTTTTAQGGNSGGGELCPSPLEYPDHLQPEEQQAARTHLDGIQPKDAQNILSLWQHAIASNKIKSSVVGYLVGLVRRFRSGTLEPLRHAGAGYSEVVSFKPSFGILKQGAEDTPAARQAHDVMLSGLLKQSGGTGELAWV